MAAVPVGLLLLVALVPVLAGLAGLVVLDAGAWRDLADTPGLVQSLWLSAWTGTAATLLALAIAHLSLAAVGVGRGGRRLRAVALPLLAMPHLAIGIGLTLLLAPSGLLLRLFSPWATGLDQPPDVATVQDPAGLALILGLAVKEVPFLLLALTAGLGQVPAAPLLRQARTLGYGPLKAWLVAVAPLLQRQIRLPLAAVLVYGVTNVEMALSLAPRTPPPFALLVWQWFSSANLADRGMAFAGAIVLGVLAAVLIVALSLAGRITSRLWQRWATSGRRAAASGPLRWALTPWVVLAGLGFGALLALLLRSLAGPWRFPAVLPEFVDASAWSGAATDLLPVTLTTLALAVSASLVAVALVLAAAEVLHARPAGRRLVGGLLFVPLLLPQMAFLFGLQVLLVRTDLDGRPAAVVWSHLVFALPYVWGLLAEARASLDPRLAQVARLLGAGALRTWITVTAPLLLRSSLLALALAFAVSVAVYLPTLFAGAGRLATLATRAAAAMAAGDIRYAAAYGAAQALLPLLAFALAGIAGHWLLRHRRGVPG